MKSTWCAALAAVGAAGAISVVTGFAEPDQEADSAEQQMDQISYGLGFFLGEEIRDGLGRDGVMAELDMVIRGFNDGLRDLEPMMDEDELEDLLEVVHEEMKTRMVARLLAEDPEFRRRHDENLRKSRAYHEAFGKKPGVITLANGIQYRVMKEGDGPSPKPEDFVVGKTRVTLIDGTVIEDDDAVEVQVESVVEGGVLILQMMSVGDRWEIAIPPELAHGPGGRFPDVGPNETILADVELLEIKKEADR